MHRDALGRVDDHDAGFRGASDARPHDARPRILVVEDDPGIRLAVGFRLRASGFDVVEAGDTDDAIATARRERPDLILLDLGLPGGGGFAVMERLVADPGLETMPVVVLSAREAAATADKAIAAGAFAYLEKVVDARSLIATIRDGLARRRAATP
jgi:DNA-binding response OmpR family regulator